MASTAPAGTTVAYNLSGNALREDLSDIIYDISPMSTVFMNACGRTTAKSTLHEWQTDKLVAAGANKKIEGDDHSASTKTQPTRLKGYCQISRKDISVSGTSRKVNTAGFSDTLAFETAKAGKEIKRDMEFSMLNNNPGSAGTSSSPRVSGGVPNWITTTKHYKLASLTTMTTTAIASGLPIGDGAMSGGDWTTSQTAHVEADLLAVLALAWSAGGEVDTLLCDSIAFLKASSFTGVASRFRDVQSRQAAQIIGYSDIYVSPYGTVKIVLSRFCIANTWLALQSDMWEIAYLRPFQTVDIAKTGDSDKRILLAEWTLVAKNPSANSKAHGVK